MASSVETTRVPEPPASLFSDWSSSHSYLLLTALTLLSLLPFLGRAFHIDDPLFLWAGQQIQEHLLDPYGFQVVWDNYAQPMSEITKNPPLACYYAALVGSIAGWSEPAMHLGFLVPALALVLGTYRLATNFTHSPLLAATFTLFTPGVMVSAAGVMCDTMMLSLWIWAAIFWIEGLGRNKQLYLATSSLLVGAAGLTKYYGFCLVPLLFFYSIARKRRGRLWAPYLLIPIALLFGYQLWTSIKYGHAMFSQALEFSHSEQGINGRASLFTSAIVGASFTGGCTLSTLFLSPFLWGWRKLSAGLLLAALCSTAFALGWISLGHNAIVVRESFQNSWISSAVQLTLAVATGIAVAALGLSEFRSWRQSNSLFLGLWAIGTFIFASFVNWSVNARSIMPLIPAIGILIAQRFDKLGLNRSPRLQRNIALVLVLSGAVSLWVTKADSDWANSVRQAAAIIQEQTKNQGGSVWFEGHWGFQYYMQLSGARPMDFLKSQTKAGDSLIVPESNAVSYPLPSPQFVASSALLELKLQQPLFTMRWRRGASFYSSFFGFLPFVFGPPATEQYYVLRLAMPWDAHLTRTQQN